MSIHHYGTAGSLAAQAMLGAALAVAAAAPVSAQPVVSAALPQPMPAPPKTADLVEFDFNTTARHHFAIDPRSLLLRGNEIAQLTIVVTSSGGATNISYEAFNCQQATHRLLAIGSADGSWQPVKDSSWLTVQTSDQVLRQHYAIFKAACTGGSLSGDRDVILRRLVNPPNDLYQSR